jgi:hypothetical protein
VSTPQYFEIAPDQLNAQHLGMRAFFQWEDPNMYKIGTIVGVAADSAAIHVNLAGIDQGVVFLRQPMPGGSANPHLYLLWS